MIVVYCFIGQLPNYSIDTVHQLRLFYSGKIYFIINDYVSKYVNILEKEYNVTIIRYDDIICDEFNKTYDEFKNKFQIVTRLVGREKLFVYSFERFFLLKNLIKKLELYNIFFMELDNLLYDNPEIWENMFAQKDISFMFDNHERCSSGISYIKNIDSITKLCDSFLDFIRNSDKYMSEMGALWDFWKSNDDIVQILPIHWKSNEFPECVYKNFELFNNTIFDAAPIGIYLGGMDPIHTNGIIHKYQYWHGSLINYTNYTFEWRLDEYNRNIPYIKNNEGNWIKINNLHIHSKQLQDCLSKPI
jgi:hypothetical protein